MATTTLVEFSVLVLKILNSGKMKLATIGPSISLAWS